MALSHVVLAFITVLVVVTAQGENCQLTITVDAKQVQGICQSPPGGHPPSGLVNSEIAALKKELADLREEYKSMVDTVLTLDKETASWREIVEWPILDPVFKPDNGTLYIDPEGPTYKDCVTAVDTKRKQGIYVLEPPGVQRPFTAYCTEDGWTVVQRRFDGEENFFRDWDEYMRGFGQLGGEVWLGLENIYSLTSKDHYELRVEALGYNGKMYHSVNPYFQLMGEDSDYMLLVGNMTEGNYKDVIAELNGTEFTTKDVDNDGWWDNNCAQQYRGGFWLKNCGFDLNREFCDGRGCMTYGERPIKKSLMLIRPMGSQPASRNSGSQGVEGKKPKKQKKPRSGRNKDRG